MVRLLHERPKMGLHEAPKRPFSEVRRHERFVPTGPVMTREQFGAMDAARKPHFMTLNQFRVADAARRAPVMTAAQVRAQSRKRAVIQQQPHIPVSERALYENRMLREKLASVQTRLAFQSGANMERSFVMRQAKQPKVEGKWKSRANAYGKGFFGTLWTQGKNDQMKKF